jgi:hypothetical protein
MGKPYTTSRTRGNFTALDEWIGFQIQPEAEDADEYVRNPDRGAEGLQGHG